jgi:hypothetical protein
MQEPINMTLEEIAKRRKGLWTMMFLSSGIDVVMKIFELQLLIPTLGSDIILGEIIEWFVSTFLGGAKIDIKMRHKLVGLLPLPGVTSLSIQCVQELWKLRGVEKQVRNALPAADPFENS